MQYENKIRHSIVMITYNQEKWVRDAIESVINQTVTPFELIICDDSSTDLTWEIIQEYVCNHTYIKAIKHDENKGLNDNLSFAQNLAVGDVISHCAGDDLLLPDTLEHINRAIKSENIDVQNDCFLIVLNSLHLYPNGDLIRWDNYSIRDTSLFKSRLRFGLSYRGVGLSKNLMDKVPRQSELSELYPQFLWAVDWIKGFEEILLVDKCIFVDEDGPVYRLGSGITTSTNRTEQLKLNIKLLAFIGQKYYEYLDSSDFRYIKCSLSILNYRLKPGISTFVMALIAWISNYNNFSPNFPWIRVVKEFLPDNLVQFAKYNIYPAILSIRGRKISRKN